MGNSGRFPQGKKAATELRYWTLTNYSACCVFSCFHNPPNSDVYYRIFKVRTWSLSCVRIHTGSWAHRQRVSTTLFCSEKLLQIVLVLLKQTGFEPRIFGSLVRRSTNWATLSHLLLASLKDWSTAATPTPPHPHPPTHSPRSPFWTMDWTPCCWRDGHNNYDVLTDHASVRMDTGDKLQALHVLPCLQIDIGGWFV